MPSQEFQRQVLLGTALGFVAYLFGAILSAYTVIALPQAPDWCTEFFEYEVSEGGLESRCVKYKDTFEEYKSYHNLDMLQRNKFLVYGQFVLFAVIGGAILRRVHWFSPKSPPSFATGARVGFLSTLVGLSIFQAILPSPISWFPDFIVQAHEARVDEALAELYEISRYLGPAELQR